MVNITAVDLNLLVIFRSLCRERSTVKTAEKLALSQPAVSHALKRLRDVFSDPLFIRASRGLVPTKRALALEPDVEEILSKIEHVLNPVEFNPKLAKRRFVISTTDYFEQIALPKILKTLEKHAPHCSLVSRPTSLLPVKELESGEIDLAIAGFYGDLPGGYYQQPLFSDDFACVVKKDHPMTGAKLSLKSYAEQTHLLISPHGDMKSKAQDILKKQGFEQKFLAGVASFNSSGWIVCSTNLVLTCPRKLAESFEKYLPVKVYELPFNLKPISVVQVWHGRNHEDPAHKWLRQTVKTVCSEL